MGTKTNRKVKMVNFMDTHKAELIATLNALSEIAGKLAKARNDESYNEVAKVAKRIAELEKQGFSEDTVLTILRVEGYINSEQLAQVLNMEI